MTFRVQPQMSAASYKTYQILRPSSTHSRAVTCAEVDCAAHLHGWRTSVDTATDLGAGQAAYITAHSGRHYAMTRVGTVVTFEFPAGQQCFAAHRAPVEREPVYVVRDGDWRGNPRGTKARIHRSGEDWVDDFAGHQQGLADRLERG